MSGKSLKTFQSDLLYSNKKVVLTGSRDRNQTMIMIKIIDQMII